MIKCPKCGYNTMLQSMRADFCTNRSCNYEERYEDAYVSIDPGGDFEDSEKFND